MPKMSGVESQSRTDTESPTTVLTLVGVILIRVIGRYLVQPIEYFSASVRA